MILWVELQFEGFFFAATEKFDWISLEKEKSAAQREAPLLRSPAPPSFPAPKTTAGDHFSVRGVQKLEAPVWGEVQLNLIWTEGMLLALHFFSDQTQEMLQ